MDKYEKLIAVGDLRSKGEISEGEFQRKKEKILNTYYANGGNASGAELVLEADNSAYLTLMHLSQFSGYLIPGLGFILPLVLWLVKSDDRAVNMHGKNIANFMISMLIYMAVCAILCIVLIGIPMLVGICIMQFVCIIIAAIKANNGEYWKYPLSISFFT